MDTKAAQLQGMSCMQCTSLNAWRSAGNEHSSANVHTKAALCELQWNSATVHLLRARDEARILFVQGAEQRQEGAADAVEDKAGKQHSPVVRMLFGVELRHQRHCYPTRYGTKLIRGKRLQPMCYSCVYIEVQLERYCQRMG